MDGSKEVKEETRREKRRRLEELKSRIEDLEFLIKNSRPSED